MSTRLLPRSLRYILIAIVLTLSLLTLVGQSLTTVQAAGQYVTTGSTYVVNSTADTSDADVGNPACADISGHCTLRAAIMQANFVTGLDTITLPSGVYLLTRPGYDDDGDVVGDLDIADDLTLQGAGSHTTIVDGNGAVTGDRVFQILPTTKYTSLGGLTIRNGQVDHGRAWDTGGGLTWAGGNTGGDLHLNDVAIVSNTARYGGGLYLEYSIVRETVDLDHVNVHANLSTGNQGGGIAVYFGSNTEPDFDLRYSQVYSNEARGGGGGLEFTGSPSSGGSNFVRIENTEIYSNTTSFWGGGISYTGSDAVPVIILNSQLHHNHVDGNGGALYTHAALVISNTTFDQNSADEGGGIYNVTVGTLALNNSTLSGNSASRDGAGIYNFTGTLALNNSTLSGNVASRDGAGLYAFGGRIQFNNATIAGNTIIVPTSTGYSGLGGGLFISTTAVVSIQNTLLANNFHRYLPAAFVADDCLGTLHLQGIDLIGTGITANCSWTGHPFYLSGDPYLGPLQNNGGPTLTQLPLPGSPAIDQGDDAACPAIDQRGFRRPIGTHCDIGAVEVGLPMYLPLIRR
jgi:CSLREA domain-containing protein